MGKKSSDVRGELSRIRDSLAAISDGLSVDGLGRGDLVQLGRQLGAAFEGVANALGILEKLPRPVESPTNQRPARADTPKDTKKEGSTNSPQPSYGPQKVETH